MSAHPALTYEEIYNKHMTNKYKDKFSKDLISIFRRTKDIMDAEGCNNMSPARIGKGILDFYLGSTPNGQDTAISDRLRSWWSSLNRMSRQAIMDSFVKTIADEKAQDSPKDKFDDTLLNDLYEDVVEITETLDRQQLIYPDLLLHRISGHLELDGVQGDWDSFESLLDDILSPGLNPFPPVDESVFNEELEEEASVDMDQEGEGGEESDEEESDEEEEDEKLGPFPNSSSIFNALNNLLGMSSGKGPKKAGPMSPEEYVQSLFNKKMEDSNIGKIGEKDSNTHDEDLFEKYGDSNKGVSAKKEDPNSTTPALDLYADDMNKRASQSSYDPVIGRDDIVHSMIEILCKRKKPNVCLTGLPGVGKSALVERLAQMIVNGEVPEQLRDKRIFSLNLNDLVAGTKLRGEYEERLQAIIKEVTTHPEIIIYIDELQNLIGNGGTAGNGDGANILKPYLARGEFKCIGSTTDEEYRKFIEKDAALHRRFTKVDVPEPDSAYTMQILKGLAKSYESFHSVKYTKEALEACVRLSDRYITDKHQPDKAIDVMDTAGALSSLLRVVNTEEIDKIKERLDQIVEESKKAILEDNDLIKGQELKDEETKLVKQLDAAVKKHTKTVVEVTEDHVAQSVSKISKVPIEKVSESDRAKLKAMKSDLGKRVIGQDKAIEVITKALQKNTLGLRNEKRPIASVLAVGPTGVGKTLICKEIASMFFGTEKALVRLDGGSLKETTSMNSLVGSPAGFVGYNDPPRLLEVKKTPRCVLLIDEVEKMHPSLFDLFLNILDDGYCNLADGTRVDFTNCIIIFTGNIGTKELMSDVNIGFGKVDEGEKKSRANAIVRDAIKRKFRPEFINRLTEIILFEELKQSELNKIYALELKKIKEQIEKTSKITFTVNNEVRDFIVEKCTERMGARELRRYIEKHIIDPLSEAMIDGDVTVTKFDVSLNKTEKKTTVTAVV